MKDVKPEDVQLLASPWSDGRTIESWFGSVQVILRVARENLDAGIGAAIAEAQGKAAELGANALCAYGFEVDPFGDLTEIRFGATAFALRKRQFHQGSRFGLGADVMPTPPASCSAAHGWRE